MDLEFVPGQRWVSNSESELGLGIVLEMLNRRVTMSFPAVGERRTYAADSAPLSRVCYEIGQSIENEDGLAITITELQEQGGYITYVGNNEQGQQCSIEEIDLHSFVQFSRPQDRLFAGQIDKNSSFQLRVETLQHLRRIEESDTYGLLGARVQLLPHQLYIASTVANRYAPRVLLADEVGLGKTIEAGLILHQQLLTGCASRVLIVVPDSLVHQWLVEMSRRFNLQFTILDEERCMELETAGHGNPFDTAQLILTAQSQVTQNDKRYQQMLQVDWDVLVVDEAHHLTWSENSSSPEYDAISTLSSKIPGLLLLTATPEQLGLEGHFARLRLLDSARYYDLNTFKQEEAGYQITNEIIKQLLSFDSSDELIHEKKLLSDLESKIGRDAIITFKNNIKSGDTNAKEILIQEILDRHGTGRVLYRNTRDAVEGFPEREIYSYALQEPDQYGENNDELNEDDAIIFGLLPETCLGEQWIKVDPRVTWLANWLLEHRDVKALVICARAETAIQIDQFLTTQHALRSAVFHEQLDLIARDRAAAYFADENDGAQVLICSEIGSEGRNFQFSHHLILFDLPLNPDLLEQRIGRLDRIGQLNTVNIHVPYFTEAQHCLLRWYHEGLNAFSQVCAIGQVVYEQYAKELKQFLSQKKSVNELDAFIHQVRETANLTNQALQNGRDRLLELNSCNKQVATNIVSNLLEASKQMELAEYMEKVCDEFGVDQQYHSTHSVVMQPSDQMHGHSFPGLAEDGITATYDRAKALVREDMQFHTWEHPMVTGAMDLILSSEFGNATLCTVKLQSLKPGAILLEQIYTIHCTAPAELQIFRYLPKSIIRLVCDQKINDLSNVLTTDHMNRLATRVKYTIAKELLKHLRKPIDSIIAASEGLANKKKNEIINHAIEGMRTQLDGEIKRLVELSKVNPNIRQEEIEHLQYSRSTIEELLLQSQLKLDAIRIAIVDK